MSDCPENQQRNSMPKTQLQRGAAVRSDRIVRHGKRNLAWAERELMKMQVEETDPQLRALWSTAARIARERISHGKAVVPNDPLCHADPKP